MSHDLQGEKRIAARAAAMLVDDGMLVGLGTGSTVAFFLEALADRHVQSTFVASSPRTEAAATKLGLRVEPFDTLARLDLTVDGADQVKRDGWLIKGGGGALTREKVIAVSAERFVVIVDSSKVVEELSAPVPMELMRFGLAATLARLGQTRVRSMELSPDGGLIADFLGDVHDPRDLARRLSSTPGVVAHGLFEPAMVDEVLVGSLNSLERIVVKGER